MRQLLLIVGSIAVCALGFFAYVELQTPPPKAAVVFQPIDAPPPPNTENDTGQTPHDGSKVFMKSYDSKTHQLSNQFRADTYNPQPDGTIDMTNPEADFFLGGGQMLTINGETGNVVDPNSVSGKVQGQSQTPSRGKMQHVILRLFKTVNDKVPQFTCWVNNLAFDNDTTRIATEDCEIADRQGNMIPTPADQVPVHVIGIDYDFDGRGLLIKWNERDRHLERLEIAHGEQLVIKHPNSMNSEEKPAHSPATPTAASPPDAPVSVRSRLPLSDADGPIALVSTSSEDAAAVAGSVSDLTNTLPATKPTTQPKKKKKKRPATKPIALPPAPVPIIHRAKDPGLYRARFYDNVHVTQAGDTLATADRMNVDFYSSSHATTQPATQPASNKLGVTDAVANDVIAGPDASSAGNATAQNDNTPAEPQMTHEAKHKKSEGEDGAATAPATQPDVPVIVRWTGKLIITPPDPDVPPLAVGDSVLQMIGDVAPAVLNRAGSIIHCASFRYHTLDQSVELNNSNAFPIVKVLDANGTRVFAPAVNYVGQNHTAIIAGPARAEFPISMNGSTSTTQATTCAAQIARADWSDTCTLLLEPGTKGDMQVTEALLDGDVHVDHPQVKINADELDLALDNQPRLVTKATTTTTATTQGSTGLSSSGQLKEMDASGSVDCTLRDSQGKPQHIIADQLTFKQTRDATGTDVPRELTADGKVHTFDQTQSLESEHLVAELEPAAPGARATASPATAPTTNTSVTNRSGGDVQLKDLLATQDVHFRATDGSFADSDYLHVQTVRPATGTLPADQEIELLGQPGARVGDKQSTLTGPIIHYNPGTKLASVTGPGTIHGIQQTVADPGHPQQPGRPVDVDWQKSFALDGIANHVDIKGDVHTKSISADGTVNTAIGDRVHVILVDATQPAVATTVPSTAPTSEPSMLARGSETNFMKDKAVDTVTLLAKDDENVEVNSIARDPAGKIIHAMNLFAATAIYNKTLDRFIVPVPGRMLVRDFRTAPATAPSGSSSSGGMHGISAFEWEKSLVYDQHVDQAVMTGDVQINHQSPGDTSYLMYADKVTIDFEPNPHSTTRPTTAPTTATTQGIASTQPARSDEDSMKVKHLVAQGQVRMISQKLAFTATEAVYDPITQIMTAHGSQREPAQLLDEQGLSTGSFDSLIYNTATDQVQLTEFHGSMIK